MPIDQAPLVRVREPLGDRVIEKRMVAGRSVTTGRHPLCGIRGDCLLVCLGADGVRPDLTEPNATTLRMGDKTVTGFVQYARTGSLMTPILARWLEPARILLASLTP